MENENVFDIYTNKKSLYNNDLWSTHIYPSIIRAILLLDWDVE